MARNEPDLDRAGVIGAITARPQGDAAELAVTEPASVSEDRWRELCIPDRRLSSANLLAVQLWPIRSERNPTGIVADERAPRSAWLIVVAVLCVAAAGCGGGTKTPTTSIAPAAGSGLVPAGTVHYLYAVTEGRVNVLDVDRGFAHVGTILLPQTQGRGIRGVAASPASHILYVSYAGDGGSEGDGSLLAYDLLAQRVLWTKSYSHGVDSMAITPDGKTIYMPDGELSHSGLWHVVDAATGNETGSVDTASGTGDNGPHNTVVGLSGQHVYMGDRDLASPGSHYLYVASTATNQITEKVGPFRSGVRPFTVNKAETLAYVSVTGYEGFQVGDLATGKVLYTVPIARPSGASCPNSGATAPSHGVSLSPDERELYVVDWPCNAVAVFDVSKGASAAPRQVATIPVHTFNPSQSPCTYDCLGDGWLLHSSDGRYVFVGDSGDVINTSTRRVIANLPQLYQTRVYLEVEWSGGVPTATTTRSGLGREGTPTPTTTTPTTTTG